jgi:hypothetical protein
MVGGHVRRGRVYWNVAANIAKRAEIVSTIDRWMMKADLPPGRL